MLLDDKQHLPLKVTNILGIKDVLLAIEPELVLIRQDLSDLLKELYVKTTDNFIRRWETDFGIKYDASLSLSERRQQILNKLGRKKTLNWENLRLLCKSNLEEGTQFYIINDAGNFYFRITVNPSLVEVFDLSKFTVTGTPTITDDGVASGFKNAATNAITTPSISWGNSVKLLLKINSGALTNNGDIITRPSNNDYCIGLNLQSNGKFQYSLSSNGTSYDILSYRNGSHVVNANSDVWVMLTYDGTTYKFYISTDGETFPEDKSVASSSQLHNCALNLGHTGSSGADTYNFAGSIDLKTVSITVNDTPVFVGTKFVAEDLTQLNKAIQKAKPAYLTFDVDVTDIVRRCGTFSCGTNPL